MEEREKKLLGYSLVLKYGETDSGLNRALGVKRLLGRGHLLYLSVVGHFFYWTVVSPSAENFSCKLFERSCPLRMENNRCSFGTPFGLWLQLVLGWITSLALCMPMLFF